MTKGKSSQRL